MDYNNRQTKRFARHDFSDCRLPITHGPLPFMEGQDVPDIEFLNRPRPTLYGPRPRKKDIRSRINDLENGYC